MIIEPPSHSNVSLRLLSHSRNRDFAYDKRGKKGFHQLARQTLLEIRLGLNHEEGVVRSNLGGPAVSGEIILHTNRVYIQISKALGERREILIRSVESTTDYSGGPNNFESLHNLSMNYEKVLDRIREISRK